MAGAGVVLLGTVMRHREGSLRDAAVFATVLCALVAAILLLRGKSLEFTLAVAVMSALCFVANRAWPYVLPELGLEDPTPRFPVLRVAIVAAVLVASGPHLTRPMRRLGWVTVFLTAFASVGPRYGDPSDAIGAFGIGLVAAGRILLAYGYV